MQVVDARNRLGAIANDDIAFAHPARLRRTLLFQRHYQDPAFAG